MASAPPLQLKFLITHEAVGFLTHSFAAPFLLEATFILSLSFSSHDQPWRTKQSLLEEDLNPPVLGNSKLSTHNKVWRRSKAPQNDPVVFVRLSNILISGNHLKGQVYAARRMLYTRSETYVLLEPGKDEIFMTLEELKERLKGWLERWPGNKLPANLNKFNNLDDAVAHLVKSACELEVDGGLGSIQWYEVDVE